MRAWEFMTEDDALGTGRHDGEPEHRPDRRTPTISLRHIQTLGKIQAKQRDELEHRKILMNLMYGIKDEDAPTPLQQRLARIDLRMKELELERLEQEIEQAENQWRYDLHRLAGNGIDKGKS